MDLEGNYILGVGATCLAKVLKDNVYVTELVSFFVVIYFTSEMSLCMGNINLNVKNNRGNVNYK